MTWLRSLLGSSPRGAAPEAPLTQDAARAENRFNTRFQTGCRFLISWRDKRGKTRTKNVKALDMTGDVALFKCGGPFYPGSLLFLQAPPLPFISRAFLLPPHLL